MDIDAYAEFVALDKAGRRKESKIAIQRFINSISDPSERNGWSCSFLMEFTFFDRFGKFGSRVRQELFDGVLWPFLREGVDNGDPHCLYWLAGLEQNLFSPTYYEFPGELDRLRLLKRAFELDQNSLPIRNALLSVLIELFRYAIHEWPWGILDGKDGAPLESLVRYDQELEFARDLDKLKKHKNFFDEFAQCVQIYRQRLLTEPKNA